MEPNTVTIYCSNLTCDRLDCPKNIENVKKDESELFRFSNFEDTLLCCKKQADDAKKRSYAYCKTFECEHKDCPRHAANVKEADNEYVNFVHLEDNPLYCKRSNWYGYQVKRHD